MYFIGFDIGGTKCAVSLGQWLGGKMDVVLRSEVPTLSSPYATFDALAPFIERVLCEYKVEGAGISCGGPLDAEAGVIVSTPNLASDWHGFNIVEYIRERFGIRAGLENDANACALAEWKFGAGRGARNLVFMTFGTGLGAGLILDGRLYSGTNGNAGEIGHIRLADSGPLGYGKAGSAEGFCSGGGIARLARLMARDEGIALGDSITARDIFERARGGDELALRAVKRSAEKFAQVLALLIDLINPEVIAVGGVFMRNYDMFMPVIRPILEEECLRDALKVCKVMPAMIGENIGDLGALAIAISGVKK
ncbi:MAG: ROK family protein [Clostridia bacterium]|nr:ROK family protein [Clostridia bacterium]